MKSRILLPALLFAGLFVLSASQAEARLFGGGGCCEPSCCAPTELLCGCRAHLLCGRTELLCGRAQLRLCAEVLQVALPQEPLLQAPLSPEPLLCPACAPDCYARNRPAVRSSPAAAVRRSAASRVATTAATSTVATGTAAAIRSAVPRLVSPPAALRSNRLAVAVAKFSHGGAPAIS